MANSSNANSAANAASAIKDSSMSILLLERDTSGDDLCVWTYPGAPMSIQNVCVNRFVCPVVSVW
jgi:hypothetical protein